MGACIRNASTAQQPLLLSLCDPEPQVKFSLRLGWSWNRKEWECRWDWNGGWKRELNVGCLKCKSTTGLWSLSETPERENVG